MFQQASNRGPASNYKTTTATTMSTSSLSLFVIIVVVIVVLVVIIIKNNWYFILSIEYHMGLQATIQYSICGKTRGGQKCIFLTIFDYFGGHWKNLGSWEAPGGRLNPQPPDKSSTASNSGSTAAVYRYKSKHWSYHCLFVDRIETVHIDAKLDFGRVFWNIISLRMVSFEYKKRYAEVEYQYCRISKLSLYTLIYY